ncbi:MAG: winged helix-turn-helix transcriptional regulator [Myxococcota bacterium]
MEIQEKPKSYRQFCGVARALDRIGERWTLLLVRNLLLGPRRYSDLLDELPGITTNLLAKRLRELTAAGIVERRAAPSPARADVYALTEQGRALEPVIMELGRWGGRFLGRPAPDDVVNIAWGLLSMKRRYRGGLTLSAGFRVGERAFELVFEPNYLGVFEREATRADVNVEGSFESFQRWLFLGESADLLCARGELTVSGNPEGWQALLRAFNPPPQRPASSGS